MNRTSIRALIGFGLVLVSGSIGGALVACSSPSTSTGTSSSANETSCAHNDLEILFSPMYSAYDGTHTYQIPAVVNGIAGSAVQWFASDDTMVKLAPDDDTGGILITTQNSGSVSIIATAGGLCGIATLTISSATTDDWNAGSQRYNNGVVLRFGPSDGGADAAPPNQASCTNCHGETANGPFKDVAHTPEQTGGFSDSDLMNIFRNGIVPDGGYFDPSIVEYSQWQHFHTWDMTDDEAKGIVVYLRSLTPTAQDGTGNFGGHYDGGGGGHHDGGGNSGNGSGSDSGANGATDSGSSGTDAN